MIRPYGPPQPFLLPPPRPRRRTRRGALLATISFVIVGLAFAGFLLLGYHADQQERAAAAASPSPAPSSTYDGSTLGACREAIAATTAKGYDHAKSARAFAALSDVAALRETAAKFSDAPAGTALDNVRALTAAFTIDTWCIQHHVGS